VLLETFNLASLWQVPVVFVCENNGFATSMHTESVVAGSITGRAAAFGIPASTVDGMDPEAVFAATADAVALARSGGGPTMLECVTYRFDVHHTFEYVARPRYRTDEEIAEGKSRDPIEIQGARLPEVDREKIDAEIEALLDDAVKFALDGPFPDPSTAMDYLYADGMRARAGAA
jgi:acetoin:2,6-dichlorophenolindophenol oxidoreductase subunit alpha